MCASDTVTRATNAYERLRVSYIISYKVCLQHISAVLVVTIPEDGTREITLNDYTLLLVSLPHLISLMHGHGLFKIEREDPRCRSPTYM